MAARALELGISPGRWRHRALSRASARVRENGVATDSAPAAAAKNGDGDGDAGDGENAKEPGAVR